jgi:transcriptional regulator with XRE-family HTH domain
LKALARFQLVAPGLAKASSESEFLRLYLEFGGEQGETARELARRAGYSSPGPISECLNGRREMSAKFVLQIAEVLRTPVLFRRLFVALAKANRPKAFKQSSAEEARRAYLNLRSRVREDINLKSEPGLAPAIESELVGSLELFVVFTALEPNRGVRLEEVVKRSALSLESVRQLLGKLVRHGLVYESQEMFFSNRERIDLLSEANSRSFQSCFLKALDLLRGQALNMPEQEQDLFFHSTILVDEKTLRRIQDTIQNQVLDTLDAETKDSGDRVAHVLVGIFTRPDSA